MCFCRRPASLLMDLLLSSQNAASSIHLDLAILCGDSHGAPPQGDVSGTELSGRPKQVSKVYQPPRQGVSASQVGLRSVRSSGWLFQPLTGALSIPPTRTLFGKKVIVAELGPNVFPFTAHFRTLHPWVPLHMHMWPYLFLFFV
jgi:hypothetical protein